jgi:hypothetical protein
MRAREGRVSRASSSSKARSKAVEPVRSVAEAREYRAFGRARQVYLLDWFFTTDEKNKKIKICAMRESIAQSVEGALANGKIKNKK